MNATDTTSRRFIVKSIFGTIAAAGAGVFGVAKARHAHHLSLDRRKVGAR